MRLRTNQHTPSSMYGEHLISFFCLGIVLQITWIKDIGYFSSLAFFRNEAFKKASNIYTVWTVVLSMLSVMHRLKLVATTHWNL